MSVICMYDRSAFEMIIFHHGCTILYLFFIAEFYNSLCLGYHLIGNGRNITRLRRQSGCSVAQYKCANGQCIPRYNFCDEEAQCLDGSDEYLHCDTDRSDNCVAPVIENGSFEVLGHGYIQGQPIPNYGIVKFICNAGFTLFPNYKSAHCYSGSFNLRQLPKCSKFCTPKIAPEVEMKCEYNDQKQDCTKPVPEGGIVTMKCKPYYMQQYLVSSNVAICQDGSWDTDTIRCKPECGELIPEGSTFIVAGTSAAKGSFPWHVAVYKKLPEDTIHKYICGGSIISVNVVVSAAHCFADETDGAVQPAEDYHIAAGKYYSTYDASGDNENVVQKRRVAHLFIPPDYGGSLTSYSSDIAVVVVDKPFVLSQSVRPVCIDWTSAYEEAQLVANNQGRVIGWGYIDPNKPIESTILRQLTAPYVDRGACLSSVPRLFKKYVTQDKFCAGYTNGSSVCNGDSGGGIVFEFKQAGGSTYFLRGVVSAGPTLAQGGCDNRNYGVYTRLSSHMKFIQSNEWKNRGKVQ